MRTVTVEFKVYNYNELSKEAKEKADKWFLETYHTSECFSMLVRDTLNDIYNLENLEFEYSLNYCQGDGFNLYGEIEFSDILERVKDKLEESEIEYLKKADDIADFYAFELLQNHLSHFCRAFEMDVYDYMVGCLEDANDNLAWDDKETLPIHKDILKKFDKLVKEYFENICTTFARDGYDYFYKIDREEADPLFNGMEFLTDGTPYTE